MEKKSYEHYAGIDISKEYFNIALICQKNKENIIESEFENSLNGSMKLKKWLIKNNVEMEQTLFCMEHTGLYNRVLIKFLIGRQCDVWMEMPVRIIRSLGLQRGKNDSIDAKRIATYCLKNEDNVKLWEPPREVVSKMRDLLQTRERLIEALKSLNAPIKELCDMGIKEESKLITTHCQKSIKSLEKDIQCIDETLDQMIDEDTQLKKLNQLITSVPGVGKITSLFLLCFTNEFNLFKNPNQLACYCGVAPFEHSSGTSVRGKTRVSNMANKVLKRLFHLCALSVIHRTTEFKYYYERKVNEGKNKMSVINAVRNKLIHRIVAVVNRQTPYVDMNFSMVNYH